jgi:hypothetical protein
MSEDRAEYHIVTDADPDGDPVKHLKSTGTLDVLLRTGSISEYMHAAGEHFAHDFLAAFRDTVKTSRLEFGTRGGASIGLERLERNAHATRRVDQTLAAVGGPGSPCAAALWYVCGLGLSIREWAAREGWNGRMLSRDEAKGILVAALAILAKDYGYDRAHRA